MSVATSFKTLKETQLSQILVNAKYLEILSFAARIESLIKERTSFQKIEFILKEKCYNLLEEICEKGYIMLKYQELHEAYQQLIYKIKLNYDEETDELDENSNTNNSMTSQLITTNKQERAKSVYLNIDSLGNQGNRNGSTRNEVFNSKMNTTFNYLQNNKQQTINGKDEGIKLKLSEVLNRKDKNVKLLRKVEDRMNRSFDFGHKQEIKKRIGYMAEYNRKKYNQKAG